MTPERAKSYTDKNTLEPLTEGDGSKFNSPVSPTAVIEEDMEEFRAKMGMFNMRLTISRKVDNVHGRW